MYLSVVSTRGTSPAPVASTSYSYEGTSSAYPSVVSMSNISSSYEPKTSTQAGLPEQYYYVKDKTYYFYDGVQHIRKYPCPKNVWVLNENGWSETDRKKKWRSHDGKHSTYG